MPRTFLTRSNCKSINPGSTTLVEHDTVLTKGRRSTKEGGALLTTKKSSNFLKLTRKSLFGFIWYFITSRMRDIILVQILLMALPIKNLLWPYLIKIFVNKLNTYPAIKTNIWIDFAPILLGWLSLWLLIETMKRLQGVLTSKLYPSLEADIRTTMFFLVNNHAYSFFTSYLIGSIANKVNDIALSATAIVTMMMTIFIPVFLTLAISLIIFFSINYFFAILLLVWVVLHFGICFMNIRKCIFASEQHACSRSQLFGIIVDILNNILNVKLFSNCQHEYTNVCTKQQEERNKHTAVLIELEKIKIMLGASSIFFLGILMTWYILYSWQKNLISVGDVVLIFTTSWNIQLLSWLAVQELPKFFKEIGVCKQALNIINNPNNTFEEDNQGQLNIKRGEIVFSNVTFYYNKNGARLFDNLSIKIAGRSKVGITGFSGSGKTSFINLMTKIFQADSGQIFIDGIAINNISIHSLRKRIAVIPQEPLLFNRSIIENIKYGNINATNDEVFTATKLAHCHDFIGELPDGYYTIVGEKGLKLSGGEKQRIALARAFLKDAPILILDEATSALDAKTEQCIYDGLDLMARSCTIIIISHRLATLGKLDRVLFFNKGKIMEYDTTPSALLNLSTASDSNPA